MSRNVMLIRGTENSARAAVAEDITRLLKEFGLNVVETDFRGEAELAIAVGGDGTLLYAANTVREMDLPLIGINAGHMGFLTEVEVSDIADLVQHIADGNYQIDSRMTLDLQVHHPDGSITNDWALNEAAVLRSDPAHPAHLGVGVDGHGVSTYGADGLILATPTGSTAYSFSAGGPVVWPDVEAVVVAPLGAHGLFTRPLVVSPNSVLEVTVLPDQWREPELWCDGSRVTVLESGCVVTSTKGKRPVRLVRISKTPFSARLVHKFDLPVSGWRAAHFGDQRHA